MPTPNNKQLFPYTRKFSAQSINETAAFILFLIHEINPPWKNREFQEFYMRAQTRSASRIINKNNAPKGQNKTDRYYYLFAFLSRESCEHCLSL
jgi:hypothetical protein